MTSPALGAPGTPILPDYGYHMDVHPVSKP